MAPHTVPYSSAGLEQPVVKMPNALGRSRWRASTDFVEERIHAQPRTPSVIQNGRRTAAGAAAVVETAVRKADDFAGADVAVMIPDVVGQGPDGEMVTSHPPRTLPETGPLLERRQVETGDISVSKNVRYRKLRTEEIH